MSDIQIRKIGRAGRITLTRPHALNAVTYEMVLAIEAALDDWRNDPDVALVVIDAEGDKAFSAGGDLAEMYKTGSAGDYSYGRKFWADEYRLNAKIANYPKPYLAFCQGFTMGGGVGVSLHGSHRIVCETSKISMPECGVGLVPDVGGTHLLARSPGHLGEYLGVSGYRMDAGDAIYAGFADYFVPQEAWAGLISELEATGEVGAVEAASEQIESDLAGLQGGIDQVFKGSVSEIWTAIGESSLASKFEKMTALSSPLAMACAVALVRMARKAGTLEAALGFEYRYTYRAMERGDFVEGIRSVIVDKDRAPNWLHPSVLDVPQSDIDAMLADLGEAGLAL